MHGQVAKPFHGRGPNGTRERTDTPGCVVDGDPLFPTTSFGLPAAGLCSSGKGGSHNPNHHHLHILTPSDLGKMQMKDNDVSIVLRRRDALQLSRVSFLFSPRRQHKSQLETRPLHSFLPSSSFTKLHPPTSGSTVDSTVSSNLFFPSASGLFDIPKFTPRIYLDQPPDSRVLKFLIHWILTKTNPKFPPCGAPARDLSGLQHTYQYSKCISACAELVWAVILCANF